MAIGPDGKVTTTGLMDNSAKIAEAPDMSAMKQQPAQAEAQAPQKAVAPIAQKPEVKDPQIVEKLNSLSEEEAEQLSMVLSPSLSSILKKVVPEASDLISQFTSVEENVILPVSVVKNFAVRKYPSSSEQESVQGFVTELSESQSDNTNVPPENMQASNPNGMMVQEPNAMPEDTDAIDQGLV